MIKRVLSALSRSDQREFRVLRFPFVLAFAGPVPHGGPGVHAGVLQPALIRLLPLGALLATVTLALYLVATTSFPAPDELEHISYAAHLQETGSVLPRFEDQSTLAPGDFSRWDDRPNYIGHPSPYYLFVGQFLNRTLPPDQAILMPRLASLALLVAALAVALRAGTRAFERDGLALAVFCVGLTFCPAVLVVSRQVTNDTMALLGGALAYWGACAVGNPAREGRWPPAAGIAFGLTLALWAKPNAGVEIGLFLVAFLALQWPRSQALAAPIAAGGLVGLAPYAVLLLQCGAIVPVTAEGVWDVRHLNDFGAYSPAFFANVGATWGFLKTGVWPLAHGGTVLTSVAFWAMLGCAALGAWPSRLPLRPAAAIAVAALIAFGLVLPIHLWFASAKLGYSLPAAAFRYYLALWPALAHALAFAVVASPQPGRRLAITAVGAVALGLGWAA